MLDLAHSSALPYLYITSVTNYFQLYPDFKTTLLSEGVRSCLPHLRDCDVDVAVKEYHGIKSYALAEKRYGVLALRLGDFRPSPFRPLTRTEISSLSKILSPQKCLQYLTKIASGSFAHVYKFKRCKGSHHIYACILYSFTLTVQANTCTQMYGNKCRHQTTADLDQRSDKQL